jgi:hypothetical protein
MNKKFLLLPFIIASFIVQGQYLVKGNLNYRNAALGYVTIQLMNKTQDKIFSTAVSSESGSYELKVASPGNYTFLFSRVGFKTYDTTIFINRNIELNVSFEEDVKLLKAVLVRSFLPDIQRQANGYVFRIENSFLASANNANTILPLLPGVTSDGEGHIMLNNISVLLMIDNQEIKLSAAQLNLYLNNIRSENIKQIEFITHPTAAYDAEGIGGVIKIITKKKIEENYSGSFSNKYMQGLYPKDEVAANILVNRGKALYYGSLSGLLNHNLLLMENSRFNSALHSKQEVDIVLKTQKQILGANAGLKYSVSTKSFFSLDVNYGTSKSSVLDDRAAMNTNVYSGDILDTVLHTYRPEQIKEQTLSTTLNYQLNTDSIGGNIRITTDYLVPVSHSYDGFYNAYLTGTNLFIDSVINDNHINDLFKIYSVKVDVHKNLAKSMQVDYGVKLVNANTSVENNYRNYASTGWKVNTDLTNNLSYRENIYAGYLTASRAFGKVQSIFGIRTEYTNYEVSSSKSVTGNDYINVFPNLSMQVPVNKKASTLLGVHYNSRINRPIYESLNPFIYKMDEYSIKEGNPYLKPAISNKVSADLTFKRYYTIAVGYNMEHNTIGDVQKPLGNMVLQTFDNLHSKREFSVNATSTIPVSSKWIMVWQANLSKEKYSSADYNIENNRAIIVNVNILRFSSTFDGRMTTQYLTKGADRFLILNKDLLFSSIDFNKTVGKTGFQLKWGINDLFNSRGDMSFTYNYGPQSTTTHLKRDLRYAYISLVYNFRKGDPVAKPEKESNNTEEEQRTK